MNKFKKISTYLLVLSFFIIPSVLLAAEQTTPNTGTPVKFEIKNPVAGTSTLMELIVQLLNNVVMPVAAVAVVIWIIYAGFTFLTAQGNPKAIEEAKSRLLWSLIGAGILLGAVGISKVVQTTVEALLE